tara:strand:+ start:15 stop:719 length:705 start_codon:yes stop_codon:yes gene_type:complete
MALPRINTPKYTLVVPSTQEEIEYRPYLVKEEKILMMGIENNDQKQMITALRDVISACTDGKVNVDKLPMFDMEYIFLKIRAKSVGEVAKLGIKCSECDTKNAVEVNLDEVEVKGVLKGAQKIELTDEIGLVLKYPTVKGIKQQLSAKHNNRENAMGAIISSIESIYDKENIYLAEDETPANLVTFLESLTSHQFKKISAFFDDMPKLRHDIDFKCTKCDEDNSVALEGLQSFF